MEGHFDLDGHRRWYSVHGDLTAEAAPVVVCHGGPGSPHDYLENVPELLGERAVVLYDQLGCGRSEHLRAADPEFWTPELFERELAGLVEHLGIAERYHVLGQSWGGWLALVHALERPPGLVGVVAADIPASMSDYIACLNELVDAMGPDVAAAIREGERTGAIDTPEFQAATMAFYAAHLCRLDPWPECVTRTMALWLEDLTVVQAMTGMKQLTAAGTLADFDLTDRLAEIELPVLLVTGAYDRVRPWAAEKVQARLAHSEWCSSRTPVTILTLRSPSASAPWSRRSCGPPRTGDDRARDRPIPARSSTRKMASAGSPCGLTVPIPWRLTSSGPPLRATDEDHPNVRSSAIQGGRRQVPETTGART